MLAVRKWWLKCAVQFVLSYLPGGRKLNQQWSKNKLLTLFDRQAFEQGLLHVELVQRSGYAIKDKLILEFGTGWTPFIPYVYRIAGCRKVILCDLYSNLNLSYLQSTLQHVRNNLGLVAEKLGIDPDEAGARLPKGTHTSLESLLAASGFKYYAPLDVRQTCFPSASVDVVASRAVLEHLPEGDIGAIMREMNRILRSGGRMVHTIDHSDHWQHFDHSISRINYLKFSDAWWTLINNSLSFQNRLRAREHFALIEDAGFELLLTDTSVDQGALKDAMTLPLSKRWQSLSPEDVAILTSHIVCKKQG